VIEKVYDEFSHELKQFDIEDTYGILNNPEMPGKNILIVVDHGFIFGNTRNIEYCYAKDSDSIVVMNSQKEFLIHKSLKQLLNILPDNQFYQPHKSYLVNIYYIQKFERGEDNFLLIKGGIKIPVSKSKTLNISQEIKNKLMA
jgi:two-component system LytT family response regulator